MLRNDQIQALPARKSILARFPLMTRQKKVAAPLDIFEIHSEYCGLFSNPARLRIVWILGNEERTVTSLAQELSLSVSATSRHLSKLKDKGVVEARRDGSNLFYHVTSAYFLEGCRRIRKGIQEVMTRNQEAFSPSGETE